ncbi:hypothetical protein [Microvirga flavescens]|uniref:hypothetical protein n=1 Tax=Microvirga flavescens TaxID=2249811 RepID=UPI0013006CD8|nr:hypothetical protein [Microvirga flavescens]
MRYFHTNIDKIMLFLAKNKSLLYLCDVSDNKICVSIDIHFLEKYYMNTHHYYGDRPEKYVYVTSDQNFEESSFSERIEEIEKDKFDPRFLLIGYNDGGIISVSGSKLEFQEIEAPWWGW